MVVDAHTHCWGRPSRSTPWTNGPIVEEIDQYTVPEVFDVEELISYLDTNGVDRAVVVGFPIGQWSDNEYLKRAASHERLNGVGLIDPLAEDAGVALRTLMTSPGVIGVRLGAVCTYDAMWQGFDYGATWLGEAVQETEFWDAARETGAQIQILAHTSQLDQVRQLVDRYPELEYVLDHFCHLDPTQNPEAAFDKIGRLSQYEGVGMKLSAASFISNRAPPHRDLHDHVCYLMDHFGRERLFWGSDFPAITHPTAGSRSYRESLQWLDAVAGLSAKDLRWIRSRSFTEFTEL